MPTQQISNKGKYRNKRAKAVRGLFIFHFMFIIPTWTHELKQFNVCDWLGELNAQMRYLGIFAVHTEDDRA